jgi:dihydrofolate reductase
MIFPISGEAGRVAQRPMISLIAALDVNRVIGRDNRLPRHLPADLQRFKQLTLHKPIIMGRRTWESLPGLLPDRLHIVVTRDPDYHAQGCIVVPSPQAALQAAGHVTEVMIVGGAALYQAMLPSADRLYLTQVQGTFVGDRYFPAWDAADWQQQSQEDHAADARHAVSYSFIVLTRRNKPHQASAPGAAAPGQGI